MPSTLSAKNLAKAYKGRPVVKDVSLDVHAGEIVGLLGPPMALEKPPVFI